MPEVNITAITPISRPRVTEFRRVVRVMFGRWVAILGIVIIILLILTAAFAPIIAPYHPNDQNLSSVLEQPSKTHLLGTDELGRDVLSRIIYGSRISLLVGIVSIAIAGTIGMVLGLISGYFGGLVNSIIMRLTDAFMVIPPMILMLAISAVLGSGLKNVLVAIGIGIWPVYCRLMCGQVLSLRQSDFITAADIIGANDRRIMFLHLLPNTFPVLIVLLTTNLGMAILMEASLSFLGIGISPPTATWGAMVNNGYKYLLTNPALSFAPGIAILLVVLAFNMVGDGLRDALDPRLKGTLG